MTSAICVGIIHYRRYDLLSVDRKLGRAQNINEFKYFKRWFDELSERPAVQRGMAVGAICRTIIPSCQGRILRALLYNQRASRPVA